MSLFGATITLSAFLLFIVQPVIAKQILPWFGGSAAVWTTCMVFFQTALLAGYAYADLVVRKLAPRSQAMLHTLLLVISLVMLPISPSAEFKPVDADAPVSRILMLLTATIGLPYLLLATTGPLVQAWFARRAGGRSVYRLYALSNVASLGGLIAYPLLIEPAASGTVQTVAWSVGYALFAVLAAGSAWVAARSPAAAGVDGPIADGRIAVGPSSSAESSPVPAAPSAAAMASWLLLSALGSVMLLSITTHITQNVASIPFLWVLPLSIYLITFVLCFDGQGWYRAGWYGPLAALLAALMLAGLSYRYDDQSSWLARRGLMPIDEGVPLYAFGLFVVCMFLHGELVARKPHPAHLTRFYLMVSAGGALGGIAVGIAAPLVFDSYWELPIALTLTALVGAVFGRGAVRAIALASLAGCVLLGRDYAGYIREDTIELSRNFYGTLRVKGSAIEDDENAKWRLLHGVITHGEQYRAPKWRNLATTYYGESSGVGRAIAALQTSHPERGLRVGLIGLGTGTLASYGREGDTYRIYELNPQVLALARSRFTFLDDSRATIETTLGDARLVLEREAPQQLDLLAVDAFSSDSIPVHLITREAVIAFARHIAPGGVIAYHISNRYLDLTGVTAGLAADLGWRALRVVDDPGDDSYLYRSDWILLSPDANLLTTMRRDGGGEWLTPVAGLRPWTDDFNNLFQVLK